MNKSCSNCKFNKKYWCIQQHIKVKLVKTACILWKQKSTTKLFYDKKKRQKIRKESIKQENKVAKETGGRRQPMSGAGYHKGDAKTKLHLIEIKFTNKNSYALKRDVLEKLFYEAVYEERELPYLQVRLGKKNYCVILKDDLEYIMRKVKENIDE